MHAKYGIARFSANGVEAILKKTSQINRVQRSLIKTKIEAVQIKGKGQLQQSETEGQLRQVHLPTVQINAHPRVLLASKTELKSYLVHQLVFNMCLIYIPLSIVLLYALRAGHVSYSFSHGHLWGLFVF